MGLRWPKNPKNVENFIGQHEKLSRAAKRRAFQGKQKHCGPSGVMALQDSFYRIQIGSRVSEIRLLTQLE
jgi:hypothetical protein